MLFPLPPAFPVFLLQPTFHFFFPHLFRFLFHYLSILASLTFYSCFLLLRYFFLPSFPLIFFFLLTFLCFFFLFSLFFPLLYSFFLFLCICHRTFLIFLCIFSIIILLFYYKIFILNLISAILNLYSRSLQEARYNCFLLPYKPI